MRSRGAYQSRPRSMMLRPSQRKCCLTRSARDRASSSGRHSSMLRVAMRRRSLAKTCNSAPTALPMAACTRAGSQCSSHSNASERRPCQARRAAPKRPELPSGDASEASSGPSCGPRRLVAVVAPQVLRGALADQEFHRSVHHGGAFCLMRHLVAAERRRSGQAARATRRRECTTPPRAAGARRWSTVSAHRSAARVWPPGSWCRPVGRRTAPKPPCRRAAPGPAAGRPSGPWRSARIICLTPASAGRRRQQPRAVARGGFQFAQPGLARGAVQRRHRLRGAEALGVGLRDDLEGAQVRSQEHQAAAGCEGLRDQFGVLPLRPPAPAAMRRAAATAAASRPPCARRGPPTHGARPARCPPARRFRAGAGGNRPTAK